MDELINVASSVADAKDAYEAGKKRPPIGFRRGFVALFMGAGVGLVFFIVPGLIGMWSFNRWMGGKSERPLAAMAVGLLATAFVILMLCMVPLVWIGDSVTGLAFDLWRIGSLAVTAYLAFRIGRFLFARP